MNLSLDENVCLTFLTSFYKLFIYLLSINPSVYLSIDVTMAITYFLTLYNPTYIGYPKIVAVLQKMASIKYVHLTILRVSKYQKKNTVL